jgi:hypothetical protein
MPEKISMKGIAAYHQLHYAAIVLHVLFYVVLVVQVLTPTELLISGQM